MNVQQTEMVRAAQLAALERVTKLPPGPHVPTWRAPPDRCAVPGVALGNTSWLPACTPPLDPYLDRVVVSREPYPNEHGVIMTSPTGLPRAMRHAACTPGRTVRQCLRAGVSKRDLREFVREGLVSLTPVQAALKREDA